MKTIISGISGASSKLYEKGLACRKWLLNWCNSCNTVLANEQVIDSENIMNAAEQEKSYPVVL